MSNNLNQYTSITGGEERPLIREYDEDGNQIKVKTSTGEWEVKYNALNQAVRFTQDAKRVECRYDYLNRRVEKAVYEGEMLVSRKRFIYRGFLQLAELDAVNATETVQPVLRKTYLWDPMESTATRILAMTTFDETGTCVETLFYTHDLLKNTTGLFGTQGERRALYEYGPYGNVLKKEGNMAEDNPFRFSSEYADDELGLVYYNYRYYNILNGRWLSREAIGEDGAKNLNAFIGNKVLRYIDFLGLQAIDASLLGTGPTNSVGVATLIEPTKMAAARVITVAGSAAIVSKETLQRNIMKSGVKFDEMLKELKYRKGMWVCYVRGSTLPTKEGDKKTCCPEFIHGYGVGKTRDDAHSNAKAYASKRTPGGCSAKHLDNSYKCAKL